MRRFLVLLLISSAALLTLSAPLLADYSREKLEADRLYANGDFSRAHSKYKSLAKDGDRFSQYRLSWMYLMGEGKKQDVIESLAWSVLAAQDKDEALVDFMQTVAGMVPRDERKKANKKVSYYMRRWGDEDDSDSSRGDDHCTGWRLCNHKTSSGNEGVPSNLWTVARNEENSEQELKERARDINEVIVSSQGGAAESAAQDEAG